MRAYRSLILALPALLAGASGPLPATPIPCAGGTIDFKATSYDSTIPLTTFNVGQQVTLTAVATGITPSSFSWTIDPPHIKDYDERIGTTTTGPISWTTAPLAPSDLTASQVTFYWKPAPGQIHPLNTGPVTRNAKLDVMVGTTPCTVSQAFTVERNASSIDHQAEDFYVRSHRAPTEPDLTKGRVLDDHIEWHTVFGTRLLDFLEWHHEFIDRFNRWRAEFGYPPTLSWYPGYSIPTGIDIDDTTRGGGFDPEFNRIPTQFSLAGGSAGPPKRLADYSSLAAFAGDLEGSWHGSVHCNVGGTMCTYESPRDPLFFRWHGILDQLYANYCSLKGLACAGITLPPSDLWMADNPGDLAAGGTEPSSGILWMSPSLWNRTVQAACTPADPVPTVARTCGSAADHENPVSGVTNYLYATIRNDRPGAQEIKYLEVGAYIANASTGLAWPASFGGDPDGALPDTRQLIAVNVPAGQVTDVGPLPWVPPPPVPSDHWCLYARALSVQAPISVAEGPAIGSNTAANNNIVWRNLQIVINSTDSATFTLQNPERRQVRAGLRVDAPEAFFAGGSVRLLVPREIFARWRRTGRFDGFEPAGPNIAASGVTSEPDADLALLKPKSKRERELLGRIAELARGVRACLRRAKEKKSTAPRAQAPVAGGRIDPRRERELLAAIDRLERQRRACLRSDPNLVPLKMTRPRATIAGLALQPGEQQAITVEFSNNQGERAEFPVLIVQEVEGKDVGGNTYLVRTGKR